MRRIHCGRHFELKIEFFISMQTNKLPHSHTVIEWVQQLLFPTIVIRLIEMAVIVIAALGHVQQMLVVQQLWHLKNKQNRSHHPLVFARVLTKWKHVLGKAAWGSHIDARRALSRLWWIKRLNECGRENEIDHLIFSFADLLRQEKYVTLPAAAAQRSIQQQQGDVQPAALLT